MHIGSQFAMQYSSDSECADTIQQTLWMVSDCPRDCSGIQCSLTAKKAPPAALTAGGHVSTEPICGCTAASWPPAMSCARRWIYQRWGICHRREISDHGGDGRRWTWKRSAAWRLRAAAPA